MHLGQHSDAELVRLAKAGWSPAFAVLVHRHAPTVHAALRDDPDPLSATTAVFVHAMRELRQRDAGAPLGPWLLELIDRPPPAQPSTLSTDELDAMWLELDRRWPDGERPATTWPWRRLAIVAGVVVLAAAVPAIVLGIDAPEAGEVELRAVPVTDDGPPPDTDDADESLPTFSFPVAPDDDGADDAEPETTEPAPEPETPPTDPEPEPQPEPEPTPEPQPEPTPEPEPSATDEEDGGSVLDPVLGGDDDGGDDGGGDSGGEGDGGEGESADSGEAAASEPS